MFDMYVRALYRVMDGSWRGHGWRLTWRSIASVVKVLGVFAISRGDTAKLPASKLGGRRARRSRRQIDGCKQGAVRGTRWKGGARARGCICVRSCVHGGWSVRQSLVVAVPTRVRAYISFVEELVDGACAAKVTETVAG